MLELFALGCLCSAIVEIMLKFKSRRIMKDSDSVIVLPSKSRILDSDRMEKKPPTIGGYAKYRLFAYIGFIIFVILGGLSGSVLADLSAEAHTAQAYTLREVLSRRFYIR